MNSIVGLTTFVVVLATLFQSYESGRIILYGTRVKVCGDRLVDLLRKICGRKYDEKDTNFGFDCHWRPQLGAPEEDPSSYDVNCSSFPVNSTFEIEDPSYRVERHDGSKGSDGIEPANAAVFDQSQRSVQFPTGHIISDECCRNSCTLAELLNLCPKHRRSNFGSAQ